MANLAVGSRGDSVKSLQQQLVNQGYKIAVDGIYGGQTKSAVSQYQQKNGLAVDGIAGNQTMGSLSKLSSPAPAPIQQAQPVAEQPVTQPASDSSNPYASNPEVTGMDNYLKQQTQSQIQSATAQLDTKLASDTASLQQAYDQAIADGQISVRDAETQFAEQKALLEKQAYTDSQKTNLYGQEMGIQNSQQQIGLMQGDEARNANNINANVSARDKRVNDVKDRISAITKQKDTDLARVKSEHDAGVIQATADANANYSNNMFGVMKDTYNFNNSLKQLQESSRLQIEQMNVQQGLDLEKMQKDLENSITLEQKKYSNSVALQSQANKNAIAQASAKATAEMQAEESAYNTARARELAKYTKGTPEYQIKESQLADEYKNNIAKIHAATVYDATAKSVLSNPALSNPVSKPKDYSTNNWLGISSPLLGAVPNLITGYDSKLKDYNAYQSAVAKKNDFISDPAKYLGY